MKSIKRIVSLVVTLLLFCLFVVGCASTANLEILMTTPIEDKAFYTPASYDAYEKAIAYAQEILEGSLIFQHEVDAAANTLMEKIEGLQPRAEKTALIELKQAVEDTDFSLYLPVSCVSLEEAIANATAIIVDENAVESDVNAAVVAINQGVTELILKPDKTDLISQLDDALAFDTQGYLEISISNLESVMQNARFVIDNENATEEDVRSAATTIVGALTNMELIPDKTELITTYKDYASIDTSKYLTKTLPQFKDALNHASAVVEDKNTTEADVKAAITALNNAKASLELKPNKTKLNKLIEKAENYSESKYTTVSYNALLNEIKSTKHVQENAEATQKEVDGAITKLQGAINGLKKSTKCIWIITVSLRRTATNHVGNSWDWDIYYNGESVGRSFEVKKKEGSSINIVGKAVEHDSVPDRGSGTLKLTLKDGNEKAITFYVRENRGRYSGNRAVWKLEASCELIERI